ncbi:uncharacterized protein B0H18DRAFT_955044 [Fomitopsis serialis]|uniref:uncharacterized protein n=1 Tax=Fomitopsis serialis TaxID=139415 RepID=UPI0020080B52|nr:uncharacterized protein B0H18DRAFT_955044 [Neoantrodia serialis]KAH9925518.1 hypothetical protein B0H18DRAFT_955044 [Neoantrodia serialis]
MTSEEIILGIFRILVGHTQYSRYSATKEPVAEIQTQLKTSAACLIRAEKGLLHQSEQLGIPLVPFGGATVPNFRTVAPPNGIWALDGRLMVAVAPCKYTFRGIIHKQGHVGLRKMQKVYEIYRHIKDKCMIALSCNGYHYIALQCVAVDEGLAPSTQDIIARLKEEDAAKCDTEMDRQGVKRKAAGMEDEAGGVTVRRQGLGDLLLDVIALERLQETLKRKVREYEKELSSEMYNEIDNERDKLHTKQQDWLMWQAQVMGATLLILEEELCDCEWPTRATTDAENVVLLVPSTYPQPVCKHTLFQSFVSAEWHLRNAHAKDLLKKIRQKLHFEVFFCAQNTGLYGSKPTPGQGSFDWPRRIILAHWNLSQSSSVARQSLLMRTQVAKMSVSHGFGGTTHTTALDVGQVGARRLPVGAPVGSNGGMRTILVDEEWGANLAHTLHRRGWLACRPQSWPYVSYILPLQPPDEDLYEHVHYTARISTPIQNNQSYTLGNTMTPVTPTMESPHLPTPTVPSHRNHPIMDYLPHPKDIAANPPATANVRKPASKFGLSTVGSALQATASLLQASSSHGQLIQHRCRCPKKHLLPTRTSPPPPVNYPYPPPNVLVQLPPGPALVAMYDIWPQQHWMDSLTEQPSELASASVDAHIWKSFI